ncbi:hsp70-binding protein 1 [Patagioenas fasciata]|uniref:hsp70-binding protein 1 n=1 Tax=Patagioenas fasciata TaxID=372321 RepID=UPI003A998654
MAAAGGAGGRPEPPQDRALALPAPPRDPPRDPPHTLQGLLEMAVTAGEPRAEPREPMSEERQRWLRAAMAEALGGVSAGGPVAELRRCLAVLGGGHEGAGAGVPPPGKAEAQEEALEQLGELLENVDVAQDFLALGGLETLVKFLGHPHPPLRAGAARALGSCAQNLPPAQGGALALGALPQLLGALRGDPHPQVAPAALFAVSCLVRSQPQGLQQLEELGGLELLGGALQSPLPPLRARAAFLLHALLLEQPRLCAPLCRGGLVPRLVSLLRSEHEGTHEHAMGTLSSLAGSPEGLRACRDPPLGLERLLRERREQLGGQREFQEELEFCERLLQLCFDSPPVEGTDR